jgi:hypothetical protein
VTLVLSFQGVQIREYALDRPILSIGRHNDWISIGKHILTLKAGPR